MEHGTRTSAAHEAGHVPVPLALCVLCAICGRIKAISVLSVKSVISIIDNFFEVNSVALLYICETGDRKQAMRNRLFDSWFAYANAQEQYVIMVANIHDMEGVDKYVQDKALIMNIQ